MSGRKKLQTPSEDPTSAVEMRIRKVHKATNIPKLAQSSARRVQSFDIIKPGSMRGAQLKAEAFEVSRKTQPNVVGPNHSKSTRRKHAVDNEEKLANSYPKIIQRTKLSFLRKSIDFMQYPLIAIVAIGSAYSTTIGQASIGIYALLGLIMSVSSSYAYGGALLLLVCIPFFQLLHQSGVSQNAAIYAYELLVLGTLQAVIELWKDSRKASKLARSK